MNWFATRPIAHRGWHDGNSRRPENSLAACGAAVARGYAIEIDVQVLADGTVVVFHDDELERMTGVSGALGARDLEGIAPLRLAGTNERIPTLAAVLDCVAGQVPLLVELKNAGSVGALERNVLATLSDYSGEFAVQSFNPYTLGFFRDRAPQIPRGQLAGDFRGTNLPWPRRLLLSNLLLNGVSQPQFIAYDVRALPNLAANVARYVGGLPLVAWTVRDPDDLAVARQYADNVIFELFEV